METLGTRPVDAPLHVNHRLTKDNDDLLNDIWVCSVLEDGEKTPNDHKFTMHDISHAVSVVNIYMHAPQTAHLELV